MEEEFVCYAINHQRVACVMPALKPHHHIGAGRQPIDNFPFAFIPPLGTDDCYVCHKKPLMPIVFTDDVLSEEWTQNNREINAAMRTRPYERPADPDPAGI